MSPIQLSRRDLGFILFLASSVAIFWRPLEGLLSFSLTHDYASHIVLAPLVSVYLIYLKRKATFSTVKSDVLAGSVLFLTATILWLIGKIYSSNLRQDDLSLVTLAIVLVWLSGFLFCYGTRAFAVARFPLLFLLLVVPIPAIAIEKVTYFLQAGSATTAYGLLRLCYIPVLKQGFILRLPTLDIEVAKQCSGIRSSLALLITVLIVGNFVLGSAWRKALLVLSILPILILKNALRIVAISLLSIYVSRKFLHGWLHTSGGIVFYLLGLALFIPIVIVLRKSDSGSGTAHNIQPPGPVA